MTKLAKFRITRASSIDFPAIVQLFEKCLGDDGGTPSVDFWTWKHLRNPFGESPTLLAWDQHRLVGIRAFMKFDFESTECIRTGYRAVDTATDQDYRGKGIFRDLTLLLLEELEASENENSAFVFNTPNKQSTPGYLKMGWSVWGRPRLAIWPRRLTKKAKRIQQAFVRLKQLKPVRVQFAPSFKLQVKKDADYFDWRYIDIPKAGYGLFEFESRGSCYQVFFNHKIRRRFSEIRVCDILKDGIPCFSLDKREWFQLWKHAPGNLVTFSCVGDYRHWLEFPSIAPNVTFRPINATDARPKFDDFAFTLGDLELF